MTKKTTSSTKKKKQTKSEIEKLQLKIQELTKKQEETEAELKETKEKLLRSYADYQNYQKRVEKNNQHLKKEIKQIYLSEFIDIKELLLQAMNDENPKEGLRLILKQLEHFFNEEHISYIECIGKPFDHCLHHAVTTIEQEDCEDNTVIEEIKKGYMIDDMVLRPSHVVVAKKKES